MLLHWAHFLTRFGTSQCLFLFNFKIFKVWRKQYMYIVIRSLWFPSAYFSKNLNSLTTFLHSRNNALNFPSPGIEIPIHPLVFPAIFILIKLISIQLMMSLLFSQHLFAGKWFIWWIAQATVWTTGAWLAGPPTPVEAIKLHVHVVWAQVTQARCLCHIQVHNMSKYREHILIRAKFRSGNLLEKWNKNPWNLLCGELLLSLICTQSFKKNVTLQGKWGLNSKRFKGVYVWNAFETRFKQFEMGFKLQRDAFAWLCFKRQTFCRSVNN